MRLHIVLSTSELIEELEYEAKERQKRKPIKNLSGSTEPNKIIEPKKDTRTNAKLGELAGVSKATVTRAKKVKKENPEAYDKVKVVVAFLWHICGIKNKNPLATRLKGVCMETAGVEPASKDPAIDTSTCVVLLLNFTIHLKTDIRMYR